MPAAWAPALPPATGLHFGADGQPSRAGQGAAQAISGDPVRRARAAADSGGRARCLAGCEVPEGKHYSLRVMVV